MPTFQIPPLINGVSQQAPERRLPTQVESALNASFSPIYGLGKRPPSDYIGGWATDADHETFFHLIERDESNKYVVRWDGTNLRVLDLTDGTVYTPVDDPSDTGALAAGLAYLGNATNPRTDLVALSIADTTWIACRRVTGAMDPAVLSPAQAPAANTKHVWVKESGSQVIYTVTIKSENQTVSASVGTTSANIQRGLAVINSALSVPNGTPPRLGFTTPAGIGAGVNGFWVDYTLVMRSGLDVGATRTVVDSTANTGTGQTQIVLDEGLPNTVPANNDSFYLQINSEGVALIAARLKSRLDAAIAANPTLAGDFVTEVDSDKGLLRIRRSDGADFDITAETDRGGSSYISVIGDSVQKFTDLPPSFTPGAYVKVRGEVNEDADDYWVRFNADDGDTGGTFGRGVWEESTEPGMVIGFDTDTMPIRLVRFVTGSGVEFRVQRCGFDPRPVGDDETSPAPGFVGKPINDMFLFGDRFCILAGDELSLSRTSDFFNFWRQTVTAVLDDDPINLSVGGRLLPEGRHAVPFNEEVIIFGQRVQRTLRADGPVTPGTVSLTTATTMDADPVVRPVTVDNQLFFLQERGLETLLDQSGATAGEKYHGVREFYTDRDLGKSSMSLTDHCPQYIRGTTLAMAASPTTNHLIVVTTLGLYVYRWYDQGPNRVQSAWGRWQIAAPGGVLWAAVSGPDLIFSTPSSVCRIKLPDKEPDGFDGGFVSHLDRRVRSQDLTVNFTDGDTIVTLPYAPSSNTKLAYVITDPGPPGNQVRNGDLLGGSIAGNTITFQSQDLSGLDFIIGEPYDFEVVLSPLQVPQQTTYGTIEPRTLGRVQVSFIQLNLQDTGSLQMSISQPNRAANTKLFDGFDPGVAPVSGLSDGKLRMVANGKNDNLTVTLSDSTHFACWITGGEWEGVYWNRV